VDEVEETIALAGRAVTVRRPRRAEDLIDEHEFAEDEYLPYWAELWPSALALADVVAGRDLAGVRVLELGAGLGLPSLAAAIRGAEVTATDWSAEAVRAAAANAERNGIALTALRWRWTDDREPLGGPFDLVLASDVLYERRNAPWLLAALPALVTAGGEAWISDPGRGTADAFLEPAARDWDIDRIGHAGPPQVTVHRLRRGAGATG
jgi:predicted nicotinamide N-methyase